VHDVFRVSISETGGNLGGDVDAVRAGKASDIASIGSVCS
jgi:hypothetical protein